MTRTQLIDSIKKKKSFLCVGLDTDPAKIPASLLSMEDPVYEFNKSIIDATRDHCIAYKPNIAFYESLGTKGWNSLEKTLAYIPEGHFTIADAKCGDIGNSSRKYAETFFSLFDFDAVTVSPYMGADSVEPFLAYDGKWVILLALTSNKGANDFQKSGIAPLFEKVLTTASRWGSPDNLMFVAGATQADLFRSIRRIVPDHFLLVPGIGTQQGDLDAVAAAGMNKDCGLIVNVSRSVIYASAGADFAAKAREQAVLIHQKMDKCLARAT